MIPNLGIFAFSQNFAIRNSWGCWFQICQYCFQIPAPKYPNQAFLVQNLRIFVFSWNFAKWQIWGYIFGKKYSNKGFEPNLSIFVSSQKFGIRQIRRCWFQIWQQFFSNCSPKIPKQGIFGPKFKDFYFCTKLCNKTNSRTMIWNMTVIFLNSSPKIHKSDILGPKFKDFYFCTKPCNQKNLRALISNITMAFSNSNPKIPKWSIFCPKYKYFLILHEASHIEKFEVTD